MGTKTLLYLVYLAARMLHATYRYEFMNQPKRKICEDHSPHKTFVIATWHTNCFSGTLAHSFQNFAPLMSHSRDGDLVAFICERMGILPVRGSSSRGGKEAREQIVENFAKGYNSAITVDGPRGPAFEVKYGIIDIAKRGRVAILPLTAAPSRYWSLNSWDRMRIPKPFARVKIYYGDPIFVPEDISKEDQVIYAKQVKDSLMGMEAFVPDPASTASLNKKIVRS